MGVSKVTLNGVTLMDVTDKTVDTDNLLAGNSALRNDGESITGAVVTASPSDASPAMDGTASAGIATTYSRGDHVHPSDTNKANINNPSFTGTPTAPTASKGTNTTQIATTAFVQSAIADINYPVTSVNSKTGTVVLTASDVNALPDDTEIPTKTSDLTNDSGYITNSNIPVTSVNTKTGDVVLTAGDVNAQPQINISGILKGNGTGTITAATAGTDYQAPLPSQTGNTGKFLTTNGSALSWQTVDALPSQSGNTGKFLTTNGSSASWAEVDVPTKTSELTNDSNFVSDANYVHTDNNFTGTLKTKLEGIAEGAEVNQNAFSNVKVGTSTIAADTKTDTLTLTAGSNITLTPDVTNDAVTIAATVPTKVSDLTNDSNFITVAGAPVQSVNSKTGTVTLTASDVGALPDNTDVTKWNDVSLTKTSSNHYSGYVPYMSATDSTSATLQPFSSTKTSGKIVAWDSSGYLYSSTPTARDNSGKVATTEYVDSAISGLGSILNYKGTKATESALPSTGNVTGDVWIVSADNSEYVWNGITWEKLGPTIDLSGYVPTSRTVNGKALSTDISLDASDVGALPDTTVIPTATSDLTNDSGFITSSDIPVISVNNKTGAVSLTASDIGALPSSTDLSVYMQKGVDYVTAGKKTDTTLGTRATAEGQNNTASGNYSHAEGYLTTASGSHTHTEGQGTTASGQYGAHAEGQATTASGSYGSHAEGSYTTASSSSSHAEGQFSSSIGSQAHSEGYATLARGTAAHSEGSYTRAYGNQAHAEGIGTNASASYSHAEGSGTYYTIHVTAGQSEKEYNITEDNIYIPYGANYSNFGIMDFTYAKKWYLVTGTSTQGTDPQKKLTSITLDEALSSSVIQNNAPLTLVLSGAVHNYSHVEGQSNISGSPAQHVGGKFNVVTSGAEVIGGGTSNTERANIRTLDWSGNEVLAGKLTVGAGPTNNMDVATKTYVDTAIAGVESLPSQTSHNGEFLTTNGTTASWESVPEEVFVATYGTTTLAEILEAYNAGKFIYAVKSNNPGRLVPLEEYVSSIPQFYFSYITRGGTPQDWAVSNSGWTSTANTFGYVPTTRTINSKSLSNSITLTASDVGALPDSTTIPTATSDLTNDSGFITSSDIPVTSVNSKTGAVSLTASDLGALTNSYFGYLDSNNNIVYAPKNWNSSYLFPFVVRTISSTLRTGATVRAFDSSTNLWTISSIYYDGVAKTLPLSLSYGIYLMRYSDGTTDIYKIAKASDIPTLTSTPTAKKGAQYDSSAYLNSTTPSANDNSTKVATTAYVDNAVSSVDALPDQTGQSGKFLTTNGTTASWADNPPEIFWITVNTSTLTADKTFAEIAAAVGDNKLPIVLADGNSIYLFLYLGTTYMRFTRYIGASGKSLRCNSDDTWEIDYNANLQEQITASGLLKGDGSGGVTAATAGTDYQAPISNNVTGSGTSGYLAKFNGTNTVTSGPALGSATTTFLRNDGSWATPAGTYSLPTASTSTKGGIVVGSGLTMSSTTLNHASSITAGTAGGSSATSGATLAVPYVTYNATGHITAAGTHTHTISGFAASSHNHAAGDINSGTLGVARGGTGAASFTANCVVMSGSSTTAALTTRAVTNNTSSTAIAANTNIPTMNTIYYGLNNRLNRTTAVSAADTGYTTLMARGIGLRNADTNPGVNGAINFTYE